MPKTILVFEDTQVYDYDLATLDPGVWINDTIIEFYFAHLQSMHSKSRIHFMLPGIAYFMSQTDDASDLGLQLDHDVVLIPVNNNHGNVVGGTHWSLLVYVRKEEKFYHCDSNGKMNYQAACRFATSLRQLLPSNGKVLECNVLRQVNGFDCGVHVMATAEVVADGKLDFEPLEVRKLVHETISDKRRQIKELILRLAGEQ
jgi:sentrin-specific protease 8